MSCASVPYPPASPAQNTGHERVGYLHRKARPLERRAERLAAEIARRVEAEELRFVRLAWADPHGYSRAKMLTVPAFSRRLTSGYNINVATTTLDSADARTFTSFTRGGGMGLDEMTGSPNLTIVPDPATFRMLPWAPGVGWILCDEYFNSGVPFHFSPRQLLRKQLRRLATEYGFACIVGLGVEWYLLRVAESMLSDEHIGSPGRARPADRDLRRPSPAIPTIPNPTWI